MNFSRKGRERPGPSPPIWVAPSVVVDPPVALEDLAARIRASSNFRFSWQFFSFEAPCQAAAPTARAILTAVIESPERHAFLRESFQGARGEPFTISPLHEHARVARDDASFEQTLARAASDRLGAYARMESEATAVEVANVRARFEAPGPFAAFELTPGSDAGCVACAHHNNHLFTSWFEGVAWDWCFCLIWQPGSLAWVGCLTDVD